MSNEERAALSALLERLAGLTAQNLERQMAEPEGDSRRIREQVGTLKDLLALARELRGEEGRDVTVRFLDGSGVLSD